MGIRVHKFLGYGFTDLQDKDPRLNWECGLLNWNHEGLSGDEYFHWLAARRTRIQSRSSSATMRFPRATNRVFCKCRRHW